MFRSAAACQWSACIFMAAGSSHAEAANTPVPLTRHSAAVLVFHCTILNSSYNPCVQHNPRHAMPALASNSTACRAMRDLTLDARTQLSNLRNSTQELWPPKPKLLDSATCNTAQRTSGRLMVDCSDAASKDIT